MTSQPPPDPYGQPQPDPYGQGTPPPPGAQPQYPTSPGQYPPPGSGYGAPPAGGTTNTMAIVSLVLSLAGLAVWISAPVGAVLGHIARRQIRERGEQGDGMALAGIIVGWILTGLLAACCVGYIGLVGFAVSQDSSF